MTLNDDEKVFYPSNFQKMKIHSHGISHVFLSVWPKHFRYIFEANYLALARFVAQLKTNKKKKIQRMDMELPWCV